MTHTGLVVLDVFEVVGYASKGWIGRVGIYIIMCVPSTYVLVFCVLFTSTDDDDDEWMGTLMV